MDVLDIKGKKPKISPKLRKFQSDDSRPSREARDRKHLCAKRLNRLVNKEWTGTRLGVDRIYKKREMGVKEILDKRLDGQAPKEARGNGSA